MGCQNFMQFLVIVVLFKIKLSMGRMYLGPESEKLI